MDFKKRGKWLNVVPFGVGQYQNYQEGKAILFLTGQSLLLGTTIVTAVISNDKKKMQKIELGSFIGFLLFYSWSVYDAFVNYKRAEKIIIKNLQEQSKLVPRAGKNYFGLAYKMNF